MQNLDRSANDIYIYLPITVPNYVKRNVMLKNGQLFSLIYPDINRYFD